MATGILNGRIHLLDGALLVDHKGFPSLDAESLVRFALGVREKGKSEFLFVGEFLLEFNGVGADAYDDGVGLSKLLNAVAKSARLGRSATGQCFGVEIKNDVLLPLKVFEVKGLGILLIG